MSSIASEHGQSHFRYGPDLPFEDGPFPNPLNPDTDGDSITDGQEINGYDLTWMEPKDDGPVQHGPETYHSNPLDVEMAMHLYMKKALVVLAGGFSSISQICKQNIYGGIIWYIKGTEE